MPPRPVPQLVFLVLLAGELALAAWLGRGAAAETGEPGSASPVRFEEVAAAAGIDFVHRAARFDARLEGVMPHVAGVGAAVSMCDADGDGRTDLYATSSAAGAANALFLNLGEGGFRDAAAEAGLADLNRDGQGSSMGSIWADADGDGDEDAYVYKYGYPQLFRNDGGLAFSDATVAAGLRRWMNANAAVWLDYDRDGFLDLFAAGYFSESVDLWELEDTRIMQDSFEFAQNGGANYLWRNRGGLAFEDATAVLGEQTNRWTLGAAAADFDRDGWIDLYLANDYGPEELYLNRGGERLELVLGVGLEESSKSGMCVAIGDFRNGGAPSTYVTNISNRGYIFQGNNLRLNELGLTGRFENLSDRLGGVLADCGWAWGSQFGDFDLDGWPDLFVANGFISASRERDYWYGMSKIAVGTGELFRDAAHWPPIGDRSLAGYERSRVLHNRGGRAWADVAEAAGVRDVLDGRAVARGDLAGRGALDVAVANQKGPLLLYRSHPPPGNHWVAFDLVGGGANTSAVGAELVLHWGGKRQLQVVDGGSGFCSQNGKRLLFGLGAESAVERAVVRWPSGGEQVIVAPECDRVHRIAEGG